MRAVLQRVSQARVSVAGEEISSMGPGLLVLLAAGQGDSEVEVSWMVNKIIGLRIFPDEHDKMNRSLQDLGGEMIAVSQFTLYGDCRKGRRPSFGKALEPEAAQHLCDLFIKKVCAQGIRCQAGKFGADMSVSLCNEGPVTLLIDRPSARPIPSSKTFYS